MACDVDEPGLGWVAVIYFVVAKIIGSFILVTLLVSFVISSYSEVYEARMEEAKDKRKINDFRRRAQEQGISWFVTPKRVQRMQKVFDLIDIDGLGTIDIMEASSFLKFLFSTYMDIKFPEDQDQSEDMLMAFFAMLDPDGSNDNSFSEFVGWLMIAKLAQLQVAARKGARARARGRRGGAEGATHARTQEHARTRMCAHTYPPRNTQEVALKGQNVRMDRAPHETGGLLGKLTSSKLEIETPSHNVQIRRVQEAEPIFFTERPSNLE